MTCRCLSPGTPVSSINKTDRHDITEILLKVALNTINKTKPYCVKILQNKLSQRNYSFKMKIISKSVTVCLNLHDEFHTSPVHLDSLQMLFPVVTSL